MNIEKTRWEKGVLAMYEFRSRTGKIIVNHSKCDECSSYACVEACRVHGTNILKTLDKRAVLAIKPSDSAKLCNECLACEEKCRLLGQTAISIKLPIRGLESYRRKTKK